MYMKTNQYYVMNIIFKKFQLNDALQVIFLMYYWNVKEPCEDHLVNK